MKKQFIQFLKEHTALIPFICNLEMIKHSLPRIADKEKGHVRPALYKYLNNTEPKDFLNYSFEWDETTEGFVYWSDLDNLWLNHIRS